MTRPDSAADPSSTHQDKDGWLRLQIRALAGAARGRFDGSPAQMFLRQLGALDFVDSIMLLGAALLISVLPFVILLSSLANHHIDTDLAALRHLGGCPVRVPGRGQRHQ